MICVLNGIPKAFGHFSAADRDKHMSLQCPERHDLSVLVSIYEAPRCSTLNLSVRETDRDVLRL